MFHRQANHLSRWLLGVACSAVSAIALGESASGAISAAPEPRQSQLRYDYDYPTIGYGQTATHNRIARLQQRLDRGEVTLRYEKPRGYLDSLLRALDIDPSSQALVFSKTSLQVNAINAATPRALYFNEDTYVAYVQGTGLLEFNTFDSALGPVFYTMINEPNQRHFERENSRCLACHDTFSMLGGGVPRFLVMSSFVDANGQMVTNDTSIETTDATPIAERWAGWYVTGRSGKQAHLGNIIFKPGDVRENQVVNLPAIQRTNLDTLDGLLDTRPYPSDKSDIVALLVFEHQVNVENLVTRANFKSRTLMARERQDVATPTWAELSPKMRRMLRPMMDSIVNALFFVSAAPLMDTVTSSSGFDKWFQSRGPRDARGRSLRKLDLKTRLFTYPLSYMVYSEGFEGLPPSARDYIYHRVRDVLTGADTSPEFARLGADERKAALEILTATKPEFARLESGA
ncbi:MAG TPA: hypothetical protein VG994_18810 [Steroidobacteraceae bacterium]|nr:hypothetical protein [Steroidobacteraceae bacterium]